MIPAGTLSTVMKATQVRRCSLMADIASGNGLAHLSMSRRQFLIAGGSALSLGLGSARAAHQGHRALIQLSLVGGPSQLDTWDPKPMAPSTIRGPFRPIATSVPGLQVSELFPLLAERAQRIAIARSIYHDEAPIHETGAQLLQTGGLVRSGEGLPHVAALPACRHGSSGFGWAVLPGSVGDTGVDLEWGQGAGNLGADFAPAIGEVLWTLEEETWQTRERYGPSKFGDNCLRAARMVEAGVSCVVVNMFPSLYGMRTWDCHANGDDLPTTLEDYKTAICPMFDRAYSALLDDLETRGLLETTLVVSMGEFGRTPRLNLRGGRDHWTGVWSVLLAGGSVAGGQALGSSDRWGAEPRDEPMHAAQIAALMRAHLDC